MARQGDLIERSHHVFYEFWMLASTAYTLKFNRERLDDVSRNAHIEAFCIHFRNVVDFLYSVTHDGHQDDVKAKSYFKGAKRRTWKPEEIVPHARFAAKRDRINREIAHLTSRRFIDDCDKQWDFWGLYQEIRPLLEAFNSQVPIESRDDIWDASKFLLYAPSDEGSGLPTADLATGATGATGVDDRFWSG